MKLGPHILQTEKYLWFAFSDIQDCIDYQPWTWMDIQGSYSFLPPYGLHASKKQRQCPANRGSKQNRKWIINAEDSVNYDNHLHLNQILKVKFDHWVAYGHTSWSYSFHGASIVTSYSLPSLLSHQINQLHEFFLFFVDTLQHSRWNQQKRAINIESKLKLINVRTLICYKRDIVLRVLNQYEKQS